MHELGTILGIWPHPDDPDFVSAGVMARARQAGQHVVCAIATRGEAGLTHMLQGAPSRLPDIRTREQQAALDVTGVADLRFLGFLDGRCHLAPREEGIRRVSELMLSVRPDTILTFGPDGLTGHRDHRVVSDWVTAAFARIGKWLPANAGLLYVAATHRWANIKTVLERAQAIYHPEIFPYEIPPDLLAIDHQVSGVELARKVTAIRAHRSQIEPLERALQSHGGLEVALSDWLRWESFRHANPL